MTFDVWVWYWIWTIIWWCNIDFFANASAVSLPSLPLWAETWLKCVLKNRGLRYDLISTWNLNVIEMHGTCKLERNVDTNKLLFVEKPPLWLLEWQKESANYFLSKVNFENRILVIKVVQPPVNHSIIFRSAESYAYASISAWAIGEDHDILSKIARINRWIHVGLRIFICRMPARSLMLNYHDWKLLLSDSFFL